jgi:hypothetical protein
MKLKPFMWASIASGAGVVLAQIPNKVQGVDKDLTGINHPADAHAQ